MRSSAPSRPRAFDILVATMVVAATLLGAAVASWPGATVVSLLSILVLAWRVRRNRGSWRRRQEAIARPFPEAWRSLLLHRYDHYNRLPKALRERFEDDVRLFLLKTRITGIGVEATESVRVLVAASAVTLSLGWPDYDWDQIQEVLLYRREFDRDYRVGAKELAGQAHPWGTVILSVPALRHSFADPDDGYHVGLHEFVHLLDLDRSQFDGLPAGFTEAQARRWIQIREPEMERMRAGQSILDPYGAHEPVEFLAVAVEAFFETALALRRHNPEIYDLLAAYFQQDPAAWDDARGLET